MWNFTSLYQPNGVNRASIGYDGKQRSRESGGDEEGDS